MAQCRNCKKEVAANATICPYCHTSMPTNDFILTMKSCFMVLFLLLFVGGSLVLGVISIFNNLF